jgi:DNA-directed RNA polymerase subunit L
MKFLELSKPDFRTYTFTLEDAHVTYANTLRRLILTGVETVAFRSDMTATGTTTDVTVKHNDTPMTNEMLADRIGLLPIHVTDPTTWKEDDFLFTLNVAGDKDSVRYVKSEDFVVTDLSKGAETQEEFRVPTEQFFPKSRLTNDTCLIASLQPGSGPAQQRVEIVAKATKGTGREHARFSPVSQCSYEYTPDTTEARIQEMFVKWATVAKKVQELDKASERYQELWREFNTMQVKRCFKINGKGEPYSFDFTVESVGILPVSYIVNRACEVGRQMCNRYAMIDQTKLPDEITISPADSRIIGFDFLFRGHDHTLGNLFQTWLVENHIEGEAQPRITYAGYAVPHPLRDEMVLRIGVESGKESDARAAVAAAARGCAAMFETMSVEWKGFVGSAAKPVVKASAAAKPVMKAIASDTAAQAAQPRAAPKPTMARPQMASKK